jgi:tetratricopeptide (TPR) repeat protein
MARFKVLLLTRVRLMKCSTRIARRDKRRDMALIRGLAVFSGVMLFFSVNALPQDSAQDFSSFGPPQSFLREASALMPRIEKEQRSSAAANIAGQQARIGDLEGALVTVQRAGSPSAKVSAAGSIAYTLASQGDLLLALEVIQNSSKGEDPAKANDYISVAGWLAEHHDFEHALELARLIQQAKPYFGQTNYLVGTLLRIQAEQFKAGDRAGAQETIDEALAAVEWEKDHPVEPWFAESMPAGLYASIASQLAKEGNRPAATAVVDLNLRSIGRSQHGASQAGFASLLGRGTGWHRGTRRGDGDRPATAPGQPSRRHRGAGRLRARQSGRSVGRTRGCNCPLL